MSDQSLKHIVGFSSGSPQPLVYFLFVDGICREAFVVPGSYVAGSHVNHCDVPQSEQPFSALLSDYKNGSLTQKWNDYTRPLGRKGISISNLIEADLPPGAQYNKVARATHLHPNDPPSYNSLCPDEVHELQNHLLALSSLVRRTRNICHFVHPVVKNMGSFGNEIGDTIILAATTCESILKSILLANDSSLKPEDNLNTGDYVRLIDHLRLPEYQVRFVDFPWLSSISPFQNWTKEFPTKSILWYRAYNEIKHNRYENLSSARLDHCLCSVAAVYVLICAQFGYGGVLNRYRDVTEALQLDGFPKWSASQRYMRPIKRESDPSSEPSWYRVQLFPKKSAERPEREATKKTHSSRKSPADAE